MTALQGFFLNPKTVCHQQKGHVSLYAEISITFFSTQQTNQPAALCLLKRFLSCQRVDSIAVWEANRDFAVSPVSPSLLSFTPWRVFWASPPRHDTHVYVCFSGWAPVIQPNCLSGSQDLAINLIVSGRPVSTWLPVYTTAPLRTQRTKQPAWLHFTFLVHCPSLTGTALPASPGSLFFIPYQGDMRQRQLCNIGLSWWHNLFSLFLTPCQQLFSCCNLLWDCMRTDSGALPLCLVSFWVTCSPSLRSLHDLQTAVLAQRNSRNWCGSNCLN